MVIADRAGEGFIKTCIGTRDSLFRWRWGISPDRGKQGDLMAIGRTQSPIASERLTISSKLHLKNIPKINKLGKSYLNIHAKYANFDAFKKNALATINDTGYQLSNGMQDKGA